MTTPSISIILVVRDGMPFLPAAVESMLQQTMTDFEFLIVNDHSQDGSGTYLTTLKDSRIKVFTNLADGLTKNLNSALKASQAPWIARMDADDWSFPERLEEQWKAVQKRPDAILVSSDYLLCDEALEPIAPVRLDADHKTFQKYFKQRQNPFCHPTILFHRDTALAVGGYDDTLKTAQDYHLWLALSKRGPFTHVYKPLLKYRVRRSAVSIASFYQQDADHKRALGLSTVSKSPTARKDIQRESEGLYAYRLGFAAWIAGRRSVALNWFLKAIWYRTRVGRACAAIVLLVLPRPWYLSLVGYQGVFR